MDLFETSIEKDFLIENVLKKVFGYEGTESPFADFMSIYASGILALAGVLLIFNIIHSTLQTANAGMLARDVKSGSIIRWVVGLALLIPLPPNNFGLGVQGVVWLSAQGIHLANKAYENFDLSTTLSTNDIGFNSNFNNQLLSIVKTATSSHLCVMSAAEANQLASNGRAMNFAFKSSQQGNVINYRFGDFNSNAPQHQQLCGSLSVSYPADVKKNTISQATDKLISWADSKLINDVEIQNGLKKAHIVATNTLIAEDSSKIAKLLKSESSAEQVAQAIEKALLDYKNKVFDTFKALPIFNKEVENKMKESGIAGAGSWFFKITTISQQVSRAVNNLPEIKALKTADEFEKSCKWYNFAGTNCKNAEALNNISPTILAEQLKADTKLKEVFNYLAANSTDKQIAAASSQSKEGKAEDDFLNLFKPISSVDFNRLSYIDSTTNSSKGNALIRIQSIGQDIAIAVQAVILGMIGFSWTGIVAAVAIVAMPFLLSLLLPALALAFYLPLKVFIVWTGALAGWIVSVVLAIFGVPLWLLTHLTPNQDGVIGKTGQGYLLILEIFLKPVLLFAGFLSSIYLLDTFASLLNSFFGFAIESIFAETSSFLYVLYLISIFAIYYSTLHHLLKLLFNLITEIPDSLFQWIGSNVNKVMSSYGHQLDENVDRSQGQISAHSVGALGQVSNGITSLFNKSKVNTDSKQKQLKEKMANDVPLTQNSAEKSPFDSTALKQKEPNKKSKYFNNLDKNSKIESYNASKIDSYKDSYIAKNQKTDYADFNRSTSAKSNSAQQQSNDKKQTENVKQAQSAFKQTNVEQAQTAQHYFNNVDTAQNKIVEQKQERATVQQVPKISAEERESREIAAAQRDLSSGKQLTTRQQERIDRLKKAGKLKTG
ncbi:hypothetical protein A1D22_10900 [Pasteurellaceae bacterium LFhippo2]|nr:hypothetical protein [Pasteurellaceae bacterium LFhippo2]